MFKIIAAALLSVSTVACTSITVEYEDGRPDLLCTAVEDTFDETIYKCDPV